MKKSLFLKYFYICVALTLGVVLILATVFPVIAGQYYRQEQYSLLERNAQYAAQATSLDMRENDGVYILNNNLLYNSYTILGMAIDADIYLVDATGKTILCNDTETCNHTTYLVDQSIMSQAMDGSYREVGNLNDIYEEPHFTVAVPVTDSQGRAIGAVFASAPTTGVGTLEFNLLKMFGITGFVVLLIVFVVVYFATDKLVKPVKQMVSATENFARGDFTVRVPVESYDEIGKLSMAFNNMASALALNESSRRSFMANVSHELKTPMTTIGGFVDGILDGTIPKERQEHYLGIVSDEIKRLSRLVRSMLNIAKIEAGEMSIHSTTFDINHTVCTTIFTFEKSIDEKSLQVIGLDAGKIMVEADEDLIHQVVYNLVENAVKFANSDGYLEIIYNVNKDNQGTYIGIKNSGDGLSKEEIPKLFDRFYKTDKSRSLDKTGVGLGLHIVRSIINLHNTDIIVKSVEGEYSEFGFYLPTHQVKNTGGRFRGGDKQPKNQ